MAQMKEHAVVVGAGMGGLLAARALAEHFERVTVLERDVSPPLRECRRGIPQEQHVHALMVRGARSSSVSFPA